MDGAAAFDQTNTESWDRAILALRLLQIDPKGLGGAVIRMRASPARDALLSSVKRSLFKQVSIATTDEQLFGGTDITATLRAGRVIKTRGLLMEAPHVMLSMAERCPPNLAAKLAQALDHSLIRCLLALDEGADPDETCPPKLAERLSFVIDPAGRLPDGFAVLPEQSSAIVLSEIKCAENHIKALVVLAARFGIDTLRAPVLALRAARAHASMNNRSEVTEDDLQVAASLVYSHRAIQLPDDADPLERTEARSEAGEAADGHHSDQQNLSEEMLVQAVRSALPEGFLATSIRSGKSRKVSGNGMGAKQSGNRRGRPIPSRAGRPDGRARIDLVATLRTAAPWQRLRKEQEPQRQGIIVHSSDIRLKRFQEQSDRLLVFAVDASGSAAVSRLNEVKGALELVLAQAYSNRDHVALVAFRGTAAEVLLPPTRSLVQTKRQLTGLPGGGGTPLAAGLQLAGEVAQTSLKRGFSPTIVLLTDGRANIDLEGNADRVQAMIDAQNSASALRERGHARIVVDASKRPYAPLRELASRFDAAYHVLPRADAAGLAQTVGASTRV
ncbi:MAG: magnesium chelatase subunit D [Pseudomonadota bacterium]